MHIDSVEDAALAASAAFEKMGWEWRYPIAGVPTREDIEDRLLDLLGALYFDPKSRSVATGRLRVQKDLDHEGNHEATFLLLELGVIEERNTA